MRMPQDKQTRLNIYFSSAFASVLLLIVLIMVGINVYKYARYSSFELFVYGKTTLEYAPLFQRPPSIINVSSTSGSQITSYYDLHSSMWGSKTAAYSIGNKGGLWFQVKPQLNGEIELTSPTTGTPLADIGFDIRNEQGQTVQVIFPGHWYKVKQYGQWYTIKFQWDTN